jgi:hypothetical protein
MGRPPTACQCNQQIPITVASKPQVVACSRSEGHRGDHHARIVWPPRLASPTRPGDRTGG